VADLSDGAGDRKDATQVRRVTRAQREVKPPMIGSPAPSLQCVNSAAACLCLCLQATQDLALKGLLAPSQVSAPSPPYHAGVSLSTSQAGRPPAQRVMSAGESIGITSITLGKGLVPGA
jgi:hypothetical protein